ncbi:hypothetical protein U9M48_021810 [Paspalum notatum var. saurae]|uniref:Uncharacterized protein n=1 Tax=Paspalum notatum var. saurae TaxID=547442 RepID=A0AAQ3WU16_PASNO
MDWRDNHKSRSIDLGTAAGHGVDIFTLSCGDQVMILMDNVGVVVDRFGQPVGSSLVFSTTPDCIAGCPLPLCDCCDRRTNGVHVPLQTIPVARTAQQHGQSGTQMLGRRLSELGVGLGKVHDVLRLNSMVTSAESAWRFHNCMSTFLVQVEDEILKLQSQEGICLSSVKEMAEYFHDDSGIDEAHIENRAPGGPISVQRPLSPLYARRSAVHPAHGAAQRRP